MEISNDAGLKKERYFSHCFFEERMLDFNNFKLFCCTDNSMSPFIKEGDDVGIDLSVKEIRDGRIYQISLDGDEMIKQIFREAGGTLRLHSFNRDYPDKLIPPEKIDSLKVIGMQIYRAG